MAQRTRSKADPRRAVAYIRVSTDEQRLGPEAQRAALEAWAVREGVTVAAWCEDAGVSGGSDLAARPGLMAALGELRARRAGVLAVAKRDRLARDVYVALTIERAIESQGARVVCADGVANGDTPADAFMRTILDGAAAYERALIRARTRAALQAKRARGERTGEIPFGFRLVEGAMVEADPAEQVALARIRELRADGASVRAIAEALDREQVAARGTRWHPTTVARIVRREAA